MSEPIKVECSIDFDDEWFQEDCHWDYKRFFIITWKIWSGPLTDISTGATVDGANYSTKQLYYSLDNRINHSQVVDPSQYKADKPNYAAKWDAQHTRRLETFTYRLDFSSLNDEVLLGNRTKKEGNHGWFPISAFVRLDSKSEKCGLTTNSDYYLELPPEKITGLNIQLVSNSSITNDPSELVCSWTKPNITGGDADGNSAVDSVDGYCIELEHYPAGSASSNYVTGLYWEKITGDYYRLGLSPDSDNIEIYLEKPAPNAANTPTKFYFSPKTLGIKPGDEYQFTIYPYSHFEGALLASEGESSGTRKTPKGIVRVKISESADSWVEGQVWVMVDDGTGKGVWKEAEAIYTMTAPNVWKEAI